MDGEQAARRRYPPGGAASRWWRESDQFDWLSGYLHGRGLAMPTRRLMALVCFALVFMPLGLIGVPVNPALPVIALNVAAGVIGIGYAIVWLRGWPTRRQSLGLIISGGLVTVGTLAAAEPTTALIGCSGLVVIGGYLAFFHSFRAVLCAVTVAVIVGAICAARIAAAEGNVQAAIAGFSVVVEVSAAVPLAIHAVVRTLGADVLRSDQDALTGVLNRRAFYERATSLLSTPGGDVRLLVVMIDLDEFKRINDTYGHLAGDQALTAVGWVLRQATNSATAIIGRAGGEEFLVMDTVHADEVDRLPKRLCEAISALPHRITASVGAAVAPYEAIVNPAAAIDEMVHIADIAMYQAKNSGGNQVIVRAMTIA